MKARIVIFPIKGRNWCFSRSINASNSQYSSSSSQIPTTLKELWRKIGPSSSSHKGTESNVEVVVDFVANKMNKAWTGLEKAPAGSFKSKLHGLGVLLLSRVKPSEIFLKSIPKDISSVDITYPSSLNGRLVRRRLQLIAFRGSVIHQKYFYGAAAVVPLTAAFAVLPLPNIPFFWVLFRTYSHWRALKGSEKLYQLVSDHSIQFEEQKTDTESSKESRKADQGHWVLQPSEELKELLQRKDEDDGLSEKTIEDICSRFHLNTSDVLKFKNTM
ncbi:hypothetical protein Leryth_027213 [Lithospermum erythrorhizon]|nr:hypothetical protein Leryth_027213 [Lithospermum erythrorhizon]